MKHLVISILLGTCSCLSWAGLLVTDLAGKVEIDGRKPLAVLGEIPDGARLTLATGARLVVVDLSTGKEFLLNGQGQYLVEKNGLQVIKGPPVESKALPVGNLPEVRIATGRVAQATLVMRGIRKVNVPIPLSPVRTAVLTTTPTLRWLPVEGATSYRVIVLDDQSAKVYEATAAGNEVALQSSAGLIAGRYYSWRIEALSSQGRFADASTVFSVVPEERAKQLAQIKPEDGAPYSRRILYAAQLQEAGALEEAKLIWHALAVERPEDATLKELAE